MATFGQLLDPLRGRPDLRGKIFLPPAEARAMLIERAKEQMKADAAAQAALRQGAIPATGEIVTSAPPVVAPAPAPAPIQLSAPIDAPGYVVTQNFDDPDEPNLGNLYGQEKAHDVTSPKSSTGKRPRRAKGKKRRKKPVKKSPSKKRATVSKAKAEQARRAAREF